MWQLLTALLFIFVYQGTDAVLGGDPAEWHRHSYVVKILARDLEANVSSQGCNGVLATSSLALTVRDCVLNKKTGKELSQFLVIISWIDGVGESAKLMTRKKIGTLKEIIGDKAAIHIHPLEIEKLCPEDPGEHLNGSVWVNRPASTNGAAILPFNPSLFRGAIIEDTPDFLKDCRVIGFDSNRTDFVENRQMLSFKIDSYPKTDGKKVMIPVDTDNNKTACIGDIGIPLECKVHGVRQYQQMGLLSAAVRRNFVGATDECDNIEYLIFVALWDEDTLRLLERHDHSGYVAANALCRANAYPDEPQESEEIEAIAETDEEVKETTMAPEGSKEKNGDENEEKTGKDAKEKEAKRKAPGNN